MISEMIEIMHHFEFIFSHGSLFKDDFINTSHLQCY